MKDLDLDLIRARNEPPGFRIDQEDVRRMIDEIERNRAEIAHLLGKVITRDEAILRWSTALSELNRKIKDSP